MAGDQGETGSTRVEGIRLVVEESEFREDVVAELDTEPGRLVKDALGPSVAKETEKCHRRLPTRGVEDETETRISRTHHFLHVRRQDLLQPLPRHDATTGRVFRAAQDVDAQVVLVEAI